MPAGRADDIAGLRDALRDSDPDVRRKAARALDDLPLEAETAKALIDLARVERIPKVRSAAVHALACEGCKPEAKKLGIDVVGFLIDVLENDPSAEVRRQTIEGLRQADHEQRVQDALKAALNDASKRVRGKAAYVLPFKERHHVEEQE